MYNRFHRDQKKRLVLKSYISGINTTNFLKKRDEHTYSEKLLNKSHSWIEHHPNLIDPPNVKDSLFVKINGTIVNKQKHLLQI